MKSLLLLAATLLAACGTTHDEPFCLKVENNQVTAIQFKPSREQNRVFERNWDRGALFQNKGQ
jgi:uncharacterized lipoprotein YmbA